MFPCNSPTGDGLVRACSGVMERSWLGGVCSVLTTTTGLDLGCKDYPCTLPRFRQILRPNSKKTWKHKIKSKFKNKLHISHLPQATVSHSPQKNPGIKSILSSEEQERGIVDTTSKIVHSIQRRSLFMYFFS